MRQSIGTRAVGAKLHLGEAEHLDEVYKALAQRQILEMRVLLAEPRR